ncbi:endonuclease NucS domain-containing protein [Desulfonatronospira sp.]|uniref:endonuclease NucS domain-containing protein n=1 Tax=Desulfonatronospira sp. TaxID=1962951 RepID=UPI0025C0A3B0|nr:endonuclease NucS domain-containing protein [Desulfonatronospira sp.]
MRVFSIQPDGRFKEFVQTPFQVEHEEKILEDWLESSPDGIIEDGKVLIIGRQVSTSLGGFIDLLGLDRGGDLVVVELKRDKTPRDTIAQLLEYASFAERLDSAQLEDILRSYLNDESLNLAEHHREYFGLSPEEAVAFNKDQRIVIVGQRITPEIRQTSAFLRSKGIRITCVEFTFFQSEGGKRLLSQEIVVGRESERPSQVSSGSLPVVTEEEFLASLDDNGRPVFSSILELARNKSMPIHWGTKGFSLNVDIDGTRVAICFVYPPDSVYKQTLRTTLRDRGGVEKKTAVPEEAIQALRKQAEDTGLFVPAGRDLKCHITWMLTDKEIESLVYWCETVEKTVKKYGLKH